MIQKLKARFDKTESDLIQRFKFNNRVQLPDESVEDFVLSIKLQAEFCQFGNFKEAAVRDRIIAGVRDRALQQRLLNEETLTLEAVEKIITTWEMAGANARTLVTNTNQDNDQIASVSHPIKTGSHFDKLIAAYNLAQQDTKGKRQGEHRGPVKSRLGFKNKTFQREGRNPAEWRESQYRKRPDYSDYICDFCGLKGHIKRKCFKLKNLKRDTVQFVDNWEQPGPSKSSGLSEAFSKMRAEDSDSDDERDMGGNWKRNLHCSSKAN
ncbi:uncharacterized protein LOC131425461 [Malaya genurostris]|uniref:uncharacterized protein LOC131425461 n=1 Tax=Malaya genurostris TaxID=325434 RepID=UPI0026F3D8B7|nr:uncharacterized protein LOC131425461 [Malaya genurostris]